MYVEGKGYTPTGDSWKPKKVENIIGNTGTYGSDYLQLSGGFMTEPYEHETFILDLIGVKNQTNYLAYRNMDEMILLKKSIRKKEKYITENQIENEPGEKKPAVDTFLR